MLKIFVVVLLMIELVLCQNNKTFCEKCTCEYDNNIFVSNCASKNIDWSSQQWSKALLERNLSQDAYIILILNNNNIQNLKEIPSINASKIDISLMNCNLEIIEYGAFRNLKTINHLILGYNNLTGDAVRGDIFKGPNDIKEYEPLNLETLNLEHNLIHSLERRTFQHLPRLKNLYLNDNPMNIIDAVTTIALSSITKLQILDLSRIGINSIADGMFNNLKYLKQLFLSGNKLTTVPQAIGALGKSLTFLSINENQIEELDDNSFLGLRKLEILEASGMTTLKRVNAESFLQLTQLTSLTLNNNPNLEYINENLFSENKTKFKLKELKLDGNGLSIVPTELLLFCDEQTVSLENNPWDCDCITVTNMISKDLGKTLIVPSNATCWTPINVSGKNLEDLNTENACGTSSIQRPHPSRWMKPNSVIVGFSVVIILVFISVIIGTRVTHWRNRLRDAGSEPVRYVNIVTEGI